MSVSQKRTPNIIFQNEHFVVVDKPAQWLSVFSRQGEKETRPVVGVFLKEQLGKEVFPCHRLDFEVSGLMLFALNAKAHGVSQKWFEKHLVRKEYLAQTHFLGDDLWPQNIERKLLKDELIAGQVWTWKTMMSRGKRRAYVDAKGLSAVTEARFLKSDDNSLSWILSPITGRSHQLRLEMALRGFVIRGDHLYGAKEKTDGIALQASYLKLHNVPKEELMGLPQEIQVPELLFYG